MCGIAGMVGLSFDENIAHAMLNTMKRRGPDENDAFFTPECCMLHSRLAVIDISGGHQPMSMTWGGETYTVVYNGEIYNTDEIRRLLAANGHRFRGHSDTEVVLHAYAHWAEGCVEKFNGIFAFAVWAHKRKKLFLARDRMGVKPLFYMQHGGGFLFASEIKTILTYPTVQAQLDSEGAAQLLLLGPGRIPGSGVFKNIYELEPGCHGYYACGKWNWQRYWKLTDREHTDTFEQTAEKVRELVIDSVTRQMVSDVPIGTFLSGGLDSSIISAICANRLRDEGKQLCTFSVDYKNNDKHFKAGKFQPDTDAPYIQIMRDYLGTDHQLTVLTPEELTAALQESTIARDLPGMADVDFSLLAFCKDVRSKVKVALSGECADEIFGGYPWYRDPQVREMDGFPWSQNVAERASFLSDGLKQKLNPREFVNDLYTQTISQCDILPGTEKTERRMKEMVNLNQRWFMQTLLDRKDRMSMYNGLEVRVPFCDYRIAEYMYSVPWSYKDYNQREKGLLRYAVRDLLPEKVINRKKSPYPKTYDPRYLELVSSQLRTVLDREDAPIYGIVRKSALESLLTAEYTWPWYGQLMKVPQTIAFMLQINFWLDHYDVNIV